MRQCWWMGGVDVMTFLLVISECSICSLKANVTLNELKVALKIADKNSETWSIAWWTISSHPTVLSIRHQPLTVAKVLGDGSLTSDTRQLIQPVQQTTWQIRPVLLGFWGQPSPAERHKLFLQMQLKNKQRMDFCLSLWKKCVYVIFSWMFSEKSINTHPFEQHSKDTCWCLHPLIHGQACQHLKHPLGWSYQSLPTLQTPASMDIGSVRLCHVSIQNVWTFFSKSTFWPNCIKTWEWF